MRLLLRRTVPPAPAPLARVAPPSEGPERFYLVGSATADGAGRAVVTIPGPPRRTRFDVETVAVDSPAGTAEIFRNAEAPSNLLGVAPASPNVLERDLRQPLWPGERLVVVFTGAGAGVTCTVRFDGARRALG